MHIKAKDVYEDIADDVGKRFDNSNYVTERLLPNCEKKLIGLMKYELGGGL